MSRDGWAALPHGATGLSAICDCGISWSYSFTIFSLNIGGSSSVQWRKVGRSWWLQMYFRRLLCVRIEIDQFHCVNCWVIIHCLSVSCTKINHSRYALVIWSSLQLTPKQWIIKQQFTAGADLFLKQKLDVFTSKLRFKFVLKACDKYNLIFVLLYYWIN